MEEKTYVADIDRTVYDIKDDEKDAYKLQAGLTPEIVQKISDEKNDPAWMQLFRLRSLQIYNESRVPQWGPPIDGLDMDNIVTYVRPNTKMSAKWSDVPKDIKDTLSGDKPINASGNEAPNDSYYSDKEITWNTRRNK